jgi:hypothetical protein
MQAFLTFSPTDRLKSVRFHYILASAVVTLDGKGLMRRGAN